MNRLAALALASLLALGVGGAVAATFAVAEPSSAFTDGGSGAWPLVADAETLGVPARRLASTPGPFLEDGQEPPGRTLLAVLDAPEAFTAHEVATVQRFLEAGGRVLLADPYGNAGGLAEGLGFQFQRVRLVDPEENATVRLDGGTFRVRWANPSALQVTPGAAATVLASSSTRSFLDRDGNGTIDAADPRGSFTVAVEVPVGSNGGLLLALADSGPLLGPQAGAADNPLLRRALLSHLLPEGGRLLVDESRQPARNPLVAVLAPPLAAAAQPPWSWGMAGLAAALLLFAQVPDAAAQWGPHRFDPRRFVRRQPAATPAKPPAAGARGGTSWTQRGTLALCACFALILLGLVFASPTAVGAGALLGVALTGAVLRAPPRLAAHRGLSTERPSEGSAIDAAIVLSTGSRWPVEAEVRDALPTEFDVTAGSNWVAARVRRRDPVRLGYTATPALRGPHEVGPLVVRVLDPLRLRGAETVAAPALRVLVAPRQESVRRIPFTTRVPTVTLGPHRVNRAGEGSEFHALRDYTQGDSLRSVNWKASARSSSLMVNQRVHESMTRLTLLLDARAVSGAGPAAATPLADGCRAAISIAAGALRVRDRIRLLAYGEGVAETPDVPGSRQLHEMREMLAALPARGAMGLAQAVDAIAPSLRPNTPVLVLSGAEGDPGFVEGLRALRTRGCIPLLVASPVHLRPEGEGAPEPGAAQLAQSREAALAGARALGVPVYETAEGLPLDDLFRLGGSA